LDKNVVSVEPYKPEIVGPMKVKFIRVAVSVLWTALVIAGARFTNFNEPYLPFAIGGSLVFFLRSKPSRWQIYAWLVISAGFIKLIHLPQVPFWVLRVAAASAVLGFGGLLLLGLRSLWSDREDGDNALALLIPPLILIFFILVSAHGLGLTGEFRPQTYDLWLFVFDGSLGFQPSFSVGRIMFNSVALTRSALLVYLSLPFAMAVTCAWQVPIGSRRIPWRFLAVLALAGIGGWLLYNVVPATGPIYVFGQSFPWSTLPYKDLAGFTLKKLTLSPGIPRNAMPSLHMGWAVLLWWNSRRFPLVLRAAVLMFLILTVVSTLGGGQHYLVDLIASLPFALTVQALASTGVYKRRWVPAAAVGAGLTALWILMVRYGVRLALISPVIPWTLVIVTIAVTLWLQHWMSTESSLDA